MMKPSFITAIRTFITEAEAAANELQSKIDKEEEKETIDDEKVDELSSLKDDIEAALEAVEDIYTGE
jgi:hypothetical protein